MENISNGESIRHVETKECGHVTGSFLRDGAIWYRVLTISRDAVEEWEGDKIRREPEIPIA
ncbi:MAG: hypothetical protein WBD25_03300 [Terriglobales bacterium]|jgi:hypothetical protein